MAAVAPRKRASDRTTNGLLPVKRQRSDWVTHKDLARLQRIADGQHDTTIQVNDATFDLWDAPQEEPAEVALDHTKLNVRTPKTMKHAPLSLVASGKPVPAVQKPTAATATTPSLPTTRSAWRKKAKGPSRRRRSASPPRKPPG